MRGPVFSLIAILAIAGCAGDRAGDGPTGGTLVIAVPGDADVLIPPIATTQLAGHVTDRLYPRLAELKAGLNTVDDSGFAPSVARSWERLDSLRLGFRLDPRARWQDGRRIDAADVIYSFGIYTDSAVGSNYRVNLASIASVTAPDSATVIFSFRRSYPEQLYDATYHLRILPRHLFEATPPAQLASSPLARHPVGAGPFRFVRWEAGSEIVVEADTTWFLGRPRLARIVWRIVPDVPAAVTALLAGEVDAVEFIPQRDEIERVRRSPDLTLVPYPSPFLGGLLFNLRRPPFADREVRRAIAMAVDRATIVQAVFGEYGEVPVGAASRMQWIAGGPVRQLAYDTSAAGTLLDSLGWRRGAGGVRQRGGRRLEFTLITPTTSRIRQEVAIHVQSQLRKAGIAVRIQPLEFPVFSGRAARGDFDALMFSRTLDPSAAGLVQFWGSASVGGDNQGAYLSPGFDSLLAAASSARGAAAAPLWRGVLERLNDDAPALFIYSPRNNAALHGRFRNVTIRPDNWLATVAAWSVDPGRRLPRDR